MIDAVLPQSKSSVDFIQVQNISSEIRIPPGAKMNSELSATILEFVGPFWREILWRGFWRQEKKSRVGRREFGRQWDVQFEGGLPEAEFVKRDSGGVEEGRSGKPKGKEKKK